MDGPTPERSGEFPGRGPLRDLEIHYSDTQMR